MKLEAGLWRPRWPACLRPLPSGAQDQGFAETTEVIAVEVPVQVVRDGEPVRGLTAEDFEIYEGRKKMPVTGFEVRRPGDARGHAAAAARLPAAARRHFLLLFDLSFSEPKSVVRAREAAAGPGGSLHPPTWWPWPPTTPAARARARLHLGPPPGRRRPGQPGLPELFDDGRRPAAAGPGRGSRRRCESRRRRRTTASRRGDGRRGSRTRSCSPISSADRAWASRPSTQKRAGPLTRSFADLAKMMGGVAGPQARGLPLRGVRQLRCSRAAATRPGRDRATAASRRVSGTWSSDERYGSTKTRTSGAHAGGVPPRRLRRSRRWTSAACAAGATSAAPRPRRQGQPAQMAQGTGGELYENFNDLSAAMEQGAEAHQRHLRAGLPAREARSPTARTTSCAWS